MDVAPNRAYRNQPRIAKAFARRLLTLGAMLGACSTAAVEGRGTGLPVEREVAEDVVAEGQDSPEGLFRARVEPVLRERCIGCHDGQGSAPGFLSGEAMRVTLLEAKRVADDQPIVDLASPARSPLLTKGEHLGPALGEAETAAVVAWIEAESSASTEGLASAVEVRASVGTPTPEGETIEVPFESTGLEGASLSFRWRALGSGNALFDELTLLADRDVELVTAAIYSVHEEDRRAERTPADFAGEQGIVRAGMPASFKGSTVTILASELPVAAFVVAFAKLAAVE